MYSPTKNPFTQQYIANTQAVAMQQGLSVGGKAGYTADDTRTFAPMITAESPTPIEMVDNPSGFDAYAMVPNRPFYHNEEIPYMYTTPSVPNINRQYSLVDLSDTGNYLPLAAMLVLGVLFIYGTRR